MSSTFNIFLPISTNKSICFFSELILIKFLPGELFLCGTNTHRLTEFIPHFMRGSAPPSPAKAGLTKGGVSDFYLKEWGIDDKTLPFLAKRNPASAGEGSTRPQVGWGV